MSTKQELVPTRWLNVIRDNQIGYQSLAIAAFILPLLISLPISLLLPEHQRDFVYNSVVLNYLLPIVLVLVPGCILQTARDGMLSYQCALVGRPAGVSVTGWHRYLFEHPLVEYFFFYVGGRVLFFVWVALLSGLAATVAGTLLQAAAGALANLPFLRLSVAGAGYLREVVTVIMFLLLWRWPAITAGMSFFIGGIGAFYALATSETNLLVQSYPLLFASFFGVYRKCRADTILGEESSGGGGGEPQSLASPCFTYYTVSCGWLYDRFWQGGMFRRAKDTIALATAEEMAGRDDADEFQPISGQVSSGGRLDTADLAARLKKLEG